MKKFPLFILLFFLSVSYSQSEKTTSKKNSTSELSLPVYICGLENINEYCLFANAGWDGNWYIGSNICWIKKLGPAPAGNYIRAYIGAQIGRAKREPVPGQPTWIKKMIKGDIYIAISSTCAWQAHQRFFLVSTEDIPLEGDIEHPVEGTGEARWFWKEIPLEYVNFTGPNFIAVWSTSENLTSRENSPILAGGYASAGKESTTWMNDEITGTPPINPDIALKTRIMAFEPAIAIKLIPLNSMQKIDVIIKDINESEDESGIKTISALINGIMIDRVWLEIDTGNGWKKTGRYIYNPPYIFKLNPDSLPEGNLKIRISCTDLWGNFSSSPPVEFLVKSE